MVEHRIPLRLQVCDCDDQSMKFDVYLYVHAAFTSETSDKNFGLDGIGL
jgi:hypothetical protein